MLLLMEEKGEKMDDVIRKLHPALVSLAKPHPPDSHASQWRSLNVVLDGTLEVCETTKGLSLGAGDLIGDHLSLTHLSLTDIINSSHRQSPL